MTLNFCLYCLSAEVMGVCLHVLFMQCWGLSPGFVHTRQIIHISAMSLIFFFFFFFFKLFNFNLKKKKTKQTEVLLPSCVWVGCQLRAFYPFSIRHQTKISLSLMQQRSTGQCFWAAGTADQCRLTPWILSSRVELELLLSSNKTTRDRANHIVL